MVAKSKPMVHNHSYSSDTECEEYLIGKCIWSKTSEIYNLLSSAKMQINHPSMLGPGSSVAQIEAAQKILREITNYEVLKEKS